MFGQDEPIGKNPPTNDDLFRGKTRDGPLGHLGRPPEPKPWGGTPQVISVVQVPVKAKADSALQDMCICMLSVDDPSLKNGQFFPRGDTNRNTKAPWVAVYMLPHVSSLDQYLSTDCHV